MWEPELREWTDWGTLQEKSVWQDQGLVEHPGRRWERHQGSWPGWSACLFHRDGDAGAEAL